MRSLMVRGSTTATSEHGNGIRRAFTNSLHRARILRCTSEHIAQAALLANCRRVWGPAHRRLEAPGLEPTVDLRQQRGC
jgi:hypothetical protein